jgi:PKD repeat protein
MSASATDDWATPTITWDFGDGATGTGGSVTHTYAAAGTYHLTATATDAAGNTRALTGTVVVFAPPPPPTDEPTRGVDFNASLVSGKVLVSVPKNAPAGKVLERRPVAHSAAAIAPPKGYRQFRLLGKDDNIPIGSILDASKGVSSLTMASNTSGTVTQTGKFSKGVFRTHQLKSSALTTAVMMGGGNFKRDCKAHRVRASSAGVRAARKRPSRRLFASVHGRFRTRGRNSTATVRGTQYLVKDSCSGTTTKVVAGVVVVNDLVKDKKHTVRKGHSFTARPRNLRRTKKH